MKCDLWLTTVPRYLVVSWAGKSWEVEGARREGFIAGLICQVREDLDDDDDDDDAAYKGEKKEKKKSSNAPLL